MKKRTVFLLALSIALILAASINNAMAYFTSYAKAQGGYTIELGDAKTTITEELSSWTKHVTITNDSNSQPVYVRVKVFCGSAYQLVPQDEDGTWEKGGDGYYYYTGGNTGDPHYAGILYPGESTTEFLVQINNVPKDVKDGKSFNVVVIYETTAVQYHEDGRPYADWTVTLDSGSSEGGNL